jgi:hypothetical protein
MIIIFIVLEPASIPAQIILFSIMFFKASVKIEVRHAFGKKKICFIDFFFLKRTRKVLLDNMLS